MLKEIDSCGVGFVCNLKNIASHDTLKKGMEALKNLTHRGAVSADGKTGDGCGLLFEIPKRFFIKWLAELGASFDKKADIACGCFFLWEKGLEDNIARCFREKGAGEVFFRKVPVCAESLAPDFKTAMPEIVQAIIPFCGGRDEMERLLYITKRCIEKSVPGVDVISLSAYSVVYKGMVVAPLLNVFYPDLVNPDFVTRYCIFHQRYSTNTAPRWKLAQPFNCLAHNGEINTIKGNRNTVRAAETPLHSEAFSGCMDILKPLTDDDESDSASLDRVFKLLTLSGYSPELAINLLIPPAWEGIPFVNSRLRALLQYNEMIMKSWDGPAAVVFTDGKTVGAHLDRNGLRPLRYVVTEDGTLVAGSEAGMVRLNSPVIKNGKLGSGDTLCVKIETGRIRTRMEILNELALLMDFEKVVAKGLKVIPRMEEKQSAFPPSLLKSHIGFGYSEEDVKTIIPHAAKTGKEITFSMGDDTPLPPLSVNPPVMFRYLKQKFAQVTNPPIDPIRERLIMSSTVYIGERRNIMNYSDIRHAEKIMIASPVLSGGEFDLLQKQDMIPVARISVLYPEKESLKEAVNNLNIEVEEAVKSGARIIILSDKNLTEGTRYIPALLALSSVRVRLISKGLMSFANLIVEAGEIKDSHHVACLIGYGAHAVYPYLAYDTARAAGESPETFRKAIEEGLLKIISKMGVSCINSYRASELFDALCLNRDFVREFFPGTDSTLEGHGLADIEKNYASLRDKALAANPSLPAGGDMKYKKGGEWHAWSPSLLKALNRFLKEKSFEAFMDYSAVANETRPVFVRHLLDFPPAAPIPVEQVEPESAILKYFATGGMSLGALSPEAHETLVEACNRLGMKCNSGEGGEDPKRYWTEKGSSIKQVASGRFGVTPAYLASAKEIEIKVAQGAKPGEGGQLPGDKVSPYIAYLRYSQPGMTLISPPPHHDIYSIEDLAQLINDLKQANPEARICVKLVSESGIGQIATGVAKAYADLIQISSAEGGTGASPYVSIKNAGNYWETGLIESHLALVESDLREKVTLRVDGGFKTGRDVVIAAFLGAEEFGFGTSAMLAEGCVMARQCHLNTCPAGIATQDPELRKRFRGSVEDVMAYFTAVAGEVRQILADLGYVRLRDVLGKAHLLREKEWKEYPQAQGVKAGELIKGYGQHTHKYGIIRRSEPEGSELNLKICDDINTFIEKRNPVVKVYSIRNTDRSVPVRLGYYISKHHREAGLPDDTIKLMFEGSAGQSFGAFNHRGVSLHLAGEANDYVGKGMYGGRIVIRPKEALVTHKNHIAGNTLLYGATGGDVFIAGIVGERFAVRNSGAYAVIEGAGHHLCEYMTGGVVLSLGTVGLNVGSGMTGGVAYIFDEAENLENRLNADYVAAGVMDESDYKVLEAMIHKHYYYTNSPRANEIMTHYENFKHKFKKIIPR